MAKSLNFYVESLYDNLNKELSVLEDDTHDECDLHSSYRHAIADAVRSWMDSFLEDHVYDTRVSVQFLSCPNMASVECSVEFYIVCFVRASGKTVWFKRFESDFTIPRSIRGKWKICSKQANFGDYFYQITNIDDLKNSEMTPGDILQRIEEKTKRLNTVVDIDWTPLFDAFEGLRGPEDEQQAIKQMYSLIEERLRPGPAQILKIRKNKKRKADS